MLIEWGSTWLWDSLQLVGEGNWLRQAIQDRTCSVVTNGLYTKELYPDLCSAAFVLDVAKAEEKFSDPSRKNRLRRAFIEESY